MNESMLEKLKEAGVDTEGALRRFVGNAKLYCQFLSDFPNDENFSLILPALEKQDFEGALTAVHTLKGVSGNLGLNRLFAASSNMVALIRAGEHEKAAASYGEVKRAYEDICACIKSLGD
jgi:HPt (histidine-containing phosphotransfer) domain-containing protein